MKEMTAAGVGVCVKRADPISPDDELRLWNSGVMNMSTSKGLSYVVLFYNCKTFGMRGNMEHKNLDACQFTFASSDEGSYILFNGWNSKTFNGGLEHRRFVPRSIKHFDNGDERCVFKIFKLYLSMIPTSGPFYRR